MVLVSLAFSVITSAVYAFAAFGREPVTEVPMKAFFSDYLHFFRTAPALYWPLLAIGALGVGVHYTAISEIGSFSPDFVCRPAPEQ